MLTDEERRIVIDAMRSYPPGINPGAWGHGPMARAEEDDEDEFCGPDQFDRKVLEECG